MVYRVTHYAVEADEREEEPRDCEDSKDGSYEALEEESFVHVLFHRLDVENSESWIDGVDLVLHGIDERGGIAFVAGHDGVAVSGGVVSDGLVDGAVEDGSQIFVDGACLGVLNHADDLVGNAGSVDDVSDRVFALEESADKLFVDDADARCSRVLFAEVASRDAGNAESFKVIGPGHVELDDVLALRLGAAGDFETVGTMAHRERYTVGGGGGDDAWERGDAFPHGTEKLDGTLGGVAVKLWVDGHHDDTARAKADVDSGGVFEAAEEESGGAEQDEGERDLRDDERAAQAPAMARAGKCLFAFEGVRHERARGGPGGNEAADEARNQAEEEAVEKNATVDVDGYIHRDGDGKMEGGECVGRPDGKQDSNDASREGEDDAFDKELAEKLCARGSERETHSHLTLALRSLREEKIGNVGAGDEEDEKRDRGESGEEEDDGSFAPRRRRVGWFKVEAVVLVGLGMGLGEALGDDLELLHGLDLGYSGLKGCGDSNPLGVARLFFRRVGGELGKVAERDPELRIEDGVEPVEVGRSDADDGVQVAGDGDGLADDGRSAGEVLLPSSVAENDDRCVVFARREAAAAGHAELSDVEVVLSGGLSPETLGLA